MSITRRELERPWKCCAPLTCLVGLGLWLGLAIPLIVAWAATVQGAGAAAAPRGHDLVLAIDARWAGCSGGGYWPIRIRLTNTTHARSLRFLFVDATGGISRLPTVEKRVVVNSGATTQFTLPVPMVSQGQFGELRVYENGRLLEGLTQRFSLSNAGSGVADRPALLVIHPSPGTVDCAPFDEAASLLAVSSQRGGNLTPSALVSMFPGMPAQGDSQAIEPALLPDSWLDYTGLDIVALSLEMLEELGAQVRVALIHWVEAGGTLLVYDVGAPAPESEALSRLLHLERRSATSHRWEPASPAEHQPLARIANVAQISRLESTLQVTEEAARQARLDRSIWPVSPATFSRLDLLAGRVYAFPENPFPGSAVDWAWWLNSAAWKKTFTWAGRMGSSARTSHPEFFNYLVPGVGAVPVLAFMALISLFALVIGPLNYFVMWKRRRLYLLVLTIPAIAFLTSALLFGYAMVADGFRVQSRLRSVTFLDQGLQRAVSFSRLSLYAGLAPSAGLRFASDTAVFPIWQNEQGLDSGTVDWTAAQELKTGWFRSRTPTQFEIVSQRDQPGGLDVHEAAEGDQAAEVVNRFPWRIELLVLCDAQARMHQTHDLAAGRSAILSAANDPKVFRDLENAFAADRPEAPPGTGTTDRVPFGPMSRNRAWYWQQARGSVLSFSEGILESSLRRLNHLAADPPAGGLPPRSYIAVISENPGIEQGLVQARATKGLHVVLGFY
ncbi:MAG: hypothetical protein ACT4QC_01035 [Planctomycetaceae bacterium]